MKLVTFEHNGDIRVGVLGNGEVIDLRAAWGRREGAPDSLAALLGAGRAALAHAKVAAGAAAPGARRSLQAVRMGPAVVTADEVGDPHVLDISLRLNGEEMQRSNTRNLIFGVPDLIVELSRAMTLEPGDVIATGTPAGVGFARKPPVFLKPGDQVEISIARIGSLSNPVVAEGRA